jgi:hypothetical protein
VGWFTIGRARRITYRLAIGENVMVIRGLGTTTADHEPANRFRRARRRDRLLRALWRIGGR